MLFCEIVHDIQARKAHIAALFDDQKSKMGIYQIRCLVDGRVYVGSTVNFRERRSGHKNYLSKNRHCSHRLQKAWNEYGHKNFVWEILAYVYNPNLLLVIEDEYIKRLRSANSRFGFNLKPSSDRASEETREKLRKSHLGIKHTEESKRKNREAHIGRKQSEESKKKNREAHLGKKHKHSERIIQKKLGEARQEIEQEVGEAKQEIERKVYEALFEGKYSGKKPIISGNPYPSVEFVCRVLRYEDGLLYWLERPVEHFVNEGAWKSWNTRYAGKEAGHKRFFVRSNCWRWGVRLSGRTYFRSILVWAIHNGKFPSLKVSYKDTCDTLNDNIANLRLATWSQISANARKRSNTSSSLKGVTWHAKAGKWVASITANRKSIYLGLFNTPEAAYAAYCQAAKEVFGEFARTE